MTNECNHINLLFQISNFNAQKSVIRFNEEIVNIELREVGNTKKNRY